MKSEVLNGSIANTQNSSNSFFDETENCFDIPYDVLVQERLIQETDITCLSTEGQQGIIQITRIYLMNITKHLRKYYQQ